MFLFALHQNGAFCLFQGGSCQITPKFSHNDTGQRNSGDISWRTLLSQGVVSGNFAFWSRLHAQLGEHVVNGALGKAVLVRPFELAALTLLAKVLHRLAGFGLQLGGVFFRRVAGAFQHQP